MDMSILSTYSHCPRCGQQLGTYMGCLNCGWPKEPSPTKAQGGGTGCGELIVEREDRLQVVNPKPPQPSVQPHDCSKDDRKLPIDRPCSMCSGGDSAMENHSHCPPFREPSVQGPEDWPECKEFYELMQLYRHLPIINPHEVVNAYEGVKSWLRTNSPSPSITEQAAKVIEAARCIHHWHDQIFPDGSEGMTVSGEHVRKLWKELAKYDKALREAGVRVE